MKDELAAIVDDNGRVLAQTQGMGARQDMEEHLQRANAIERKKGTHSLIKRHTRGTVVTGEEAKKAIENGRI